MIIYLGHICFSKVHLDIIYLTVQVFNMGDQALIKGKRLRAVKTQKKRTIVPDVRLHTQNVLIPVVEPGPVKQSFNICLTENRPLILRAQKYKNSPALLFSETPSHTLYSRLESLFEVKRVKQQRLKNQSTKYTISGKTDSSSIKKANVLQNPNPTRQFYKKKNAALSFLDSTLGQLEPLASDEGLHKASSRSIQLSRKCNMSQLKGGHAEDEDKLAVVPKIETPISIVMMKPQIVSMPSDTFYDITDTVSTVSTSSGSSFKVGSKRMFTNIGNRKERPVSTVASHHLHPTNSEYEINVLHYENDILSSENKSPQFATSLLNSADTNWRPVEDTSSARMQDNAESLNDEQGVSSSYRKQEADRDIRDAKCSWEALDRWMPSPSWRRDNLRGLRYLDMYHGKPYDCCIKYSWQVIGTSTQTSYSLLQNLVSDSNAEDREDSPYGMCSVKYSWQIIGTSTQATLHDCNDPDYWKGMLLAPNKMYKSSSQVDKERDDKPRDHARCPGRKLKRCLILNNQQTQTFAEKNIQADVNDYYYAKYSWHNLIKQFKRILLSPSGERVSEILKTLTNQKLSGKLEVEQAAEHAELLDKYRIEPLTPNVSNKTCLIRNNSHEKTKEELLTRLTHTLKQLHEYERVDERDLDKNRNTADTLPCPDADDVPSQNLVGDLLPRNVQENISGIIESAQEYIAKLNCQLKGLDEADQQIENGMARTLKDIDETFQSLLNDVYREINRRREQLILEAEIHMHENLIPLKACRKEVETQVGKAHNIISMSENMLRHPEQYSVNGFGKIVAASNDIGRIPAVPYSEELPNICFNRPLNLYKEEIIEHISKFGCISRTVPVQIISIEERPAGFFMKWHVTDPEYTIEEQTFIVEKANGEVLEPASSAFETVYRGSETSCFIRNMPLNQPVTLRVRLQSDNNAKSMHHVTRTSIPPYGWELDNKDYVITNNGMIAAKLTDTISTLFSRGPQFDANHVIEFKFLEASQEANDDEGIALVHEPRGSNDTLKRRSSLMITPRGKIFMDGDEKLMRLPRMRFGTDITISALRKNAHVLRMNIESENKCVTYDWRVRTPLYFAARFTEYKKWNLMIK
ncbi:uncharacterized protein LOC105183880 [Harpegnathos saltator]|uniref:uncharacterized protein LOC105183880 n=1 Tax=Harpegnathos saltator TaxID=610380 RepID=UPI000590D78F|nr:uncharacterized protein LOC105183880 [Harpegnathos saltator]